MVDIPALSGASSQLQPMVAMWQHSEFEPMYQIWFSKRRQKPEEMDNFPIFRIVASEGGTWALLPDFQTRTLMFRI